MAHYVLRDTDGILKATFRNDNIVKLLLRNGHWRPYKEVNGKQTSCYEYDRDSVWGSNDGSITLHFWKGDKLILVD
jgi:hypothetical protein